jgi:hypothetical protein
MPITLKQYYCPTCGNQENHSTNHYGEIYCNCRKCGNSPLYCSEVNSHEGLPFLNATIHFYSFDIGTEEGARGYSELSRYLNQDLDYKGKKFAVLTQYKEWQAVKSHDGESIKLYNPDQFDNQFVSNIGRVFYWKEAVYPNRDIKDGYYLVIDN